MNEHLCNNGYVCNNCFLDEIREQAKNKKEDARNTNAIEDLLTELGCGCDDSHVYECDLMSPHCSVAKAEVCYTNLLLAYKNLKRQFMNQLEQIILNQSVHAPCDTRYIARCNPQEEQEMGREQVLDEIRALLNSIINETNNTHHQQPTIRRRLDESLQLHEK